MKTIKDLRDLISANDGKIVLGCLEITCDGSNSDIDFKHEGNLLQWFSKELEETELLDGKDIATVDSSFSNFTDKKIKIYSLEDEVKKLSSEKDEIIKNNNTDLLKGKIEVYEKMFIGRDLTISK